MSGSYADDCTSTIACSASLSRYRYDAADGPVGSGDDGEVADRAHLSRRLHRRTERSSKLAVTLMLDERIGAGPCDGVLPISGSRNR